MAESWFGVILFSYQALHKDKNLLSQLFDGGIGECTRGSLWIEWSAIECDHVVNLVFHVRRKVYPYWYPHTPPRAMLSLSWVWSKLIMAGLLHRAACAAAV